MKKIFKDYSSAVFAVLIIVLFYLLLFCLGITCPIKFLFGISCPGCGMTRAWLHVLRFDFLGAFSYHPLWICLPLFVVGYWALSRKKFVRACRVLAWMFACLMMGVYFWRALHDSLGVVVFAPSQGAFFRAVRQVLLVLLD